MTPSSSGFPVPGEAFTSMRIIFISRKPANGYLGPEATAPVYPPP